MNLLESLKKFPVPISLAASLVLFSCQEKKQAVQDVISESEIKKTEFFLEKTNNRQLASDFFSLKTISQKNPTDQFLQEKYLAAKDAYNCAKEKSDREYQTLASQ